MSAAAGGWARFGLIALLVAVALGALLLSSANPAGAQSGSGTVDYDTDNDNLIEVSTPAQLNAIRHDLDGDGTPTSRDYYTAFPNRAANAGCAATCLGYELEANLDLGNYSSGAGWMPIGNSGSRYSAIFEGNGHTIANLFINRSSTGNVGLFASTTDTSVVRNVGLVDASVNGGNYTGALIGSAHGTVDFAYSTGSVSGAGNVGGLVGYTTSTIQRSYSTANVTGIDNVGGLVGNSDSVWAPRGVYDVGVIKASYATGTVSGRSGVGGLLGGPLGATRRNIIASYATGSVTGTGGNVGGLVGRSAGTVTNSYWDVTTSGRADDNDAATGTGKPTAELQLPTQANGYAGIYANWNLNLDSTAGADDPWDFGTASQYPALKAEWDGDGTATAYEFGRQGRAAPVVAPVNTAPTFDAGADANPHVAEDATAVGSYAATDPEGDALTYAVTGPDAADFAISSAGALTLNNAADYETKSSYSVSVTVHDGKDAAGAAATTVDDTLALTVTVDDTPPPPAPTRVQVNGRANGLVVTWRAPVMPPTHPPLLGHTVQRSLRTSGPGVTPVTWGSWVAFGGDGTRLTPGSTYRVRVLVYNAEGDSPWTEPVNGVPAADYDSDNDGLIDVDSLAKLNAIRWDLDGDGAFTDAGYALAFPNPAAGMGCPDTDSDAATPNCLGYELMADLDFNTDTTGSSAAVVDSSDDYWDSGKGWTPIGDDADNEGTSGYAAIFEGNGHTIANLFINRSSTHDVGLFGSTTDNSTVRNVGLVDANVTGHNDTGALIGSAYGKVDSAYSTGSVSGAGYVGGLAGYSGSTIQRSYSTANVTSTGDTVGGLVGYSSGYAAVISASYATGAVSGGSRVGGLLGGLEATAAIAGSYATGSVTGTGGNVGGLVGEPGGTVTNSYWDVTTSGRADDNDASTGAGKTTAELQLPTQANGYAGIYANWNLNLDSTAGGDDPWDFGTASQYPALKADFNRDGVKSAVDGDFGRQPRAAPVDYDSDNDGLIEVDSLAKLNAIRWDLDGNGASTDAGYALAFPTPSTGMGCPSTATDVDDNDCLGYELAADLNFNTDTGSDSGGAAVIDSSDDYYNSGDGWEPIGTNASRFNTVFDGNGYTISNLFIARSSTDGVGLFGAAGSGSEVRNVGLAAAAVTGQDDVGILLGDTTGKVRFTYTTGSVAGRTWVGGLVGKSGRTGSISTSYSTASATGTGNYTGGLIGQSNGAVKASYATGAVDGPRVGGLVGRNYYYGSITASYARGAVTGSSVGGLVGSNPTLFGLPGQPNTSGTVTNSYWDINTSGTSTSATGLGTGKTTAELQTPQAYGSGADIYANWNLNLDSTAGADDPWDFGTASQYPALKADFNRDGVKSAVDGDFGRQPRAAPVVAPVNTAPTFDAGYDANPHVAEDATAVGSYAATDPEGDALTYAVTGPDAADFAISSAGALTLINAADYETKSSYSVSVTVHDGKDAAGAADTTVDSTLALTVTVDDTPPPTAPTRVQVNGRANGLVVTWMAPVMPPTHPPLLGYSVQRSLRTSGPGVTPVTWGRWVVFNHVGTGTTATITGLTPGSTYEVRVLARNAEGDSPWTAPVNGVPAVAPPVDYDNDNDGLIAVDSLVKLNAIRWDLDGDGASTDARYALAFPTPAIGMGCPDTDSDAATPNCLGYELTADLDLDTDSSGAADSGDTYWDSGAGWMPIGSDASGSGTSGYAAIFEGNGHSIANLFINRSSTGNVGLFAYTTDTSAVRNVGLVGANVTGRGNTGALIGSAYGTVDFAYSTGSVSGAGNVGGLVGYTTSTIQRSYSTANVTGTDGNVGGLVGALPSTGVIKASYATGTVNGINAVGGLVGEARGNITASYATGTVTFTVGGIGSLGGLVGNYYEATITNSYWDVTTSGIADKGLGNTGEGKTTAELRTPQGYGSGAAIYSAWNLDLDGDGNADDPWDFGTANQYPALKAEWDGDGTATAYEFGRQGRSAPVDYDSDNDGLIDVDSLAKLNAIRWDLDGNGASTDAGYALVFPAPPTGMVCPATCRGYELTADLDLDTDSNGAANSGDTYWDSGAGWMPIGNAADGSATSRYSAIFEGNGHSIVNLFINRSSTRNVGLFGSTTDTSAVRNVGLVGANVTGNNFTGALIGSAYGTVDFAYSTGSVSGAASVGGLVGYSQSTIQRSYSTANVTSTGDNVGGLVGYTEGGVKASYATGTVNGSSGVGGLVGVSRGNITASYSTGLVTGAGGLVGDYNRATITDSYWDITTTGIADDNDARTGEGKTTSQLQSPMQANGYAGIYANWNLDLDGDGSADDPWDFGTARQYPALKADFNRDGVKSAGDDDFGRQPRADYDSDNDGLIDVDSLAKLNAIRWDLDGNGAFTDAGYALAFPTPPTGMGCPATCLGYELTADLDFDTHGNDDAVTSADVDYWDSGAGWMPIGNDSDSFRYTAIFEGNGHTIANLFINRPSRDGVGLFGTTTNAGATDTSVVRNVGLVGANVTGRGETGALIGNAYGTVDFAYSTGSVSGAASVGGLVGYTTSTIQRSYSTANVTGTGTWAGGLAGSSDYSGVIQASYATGRVSGSDMAGGLVGENKGEIIASYATGLVAGTGGNPTVGGLVGSQVGTATNSYWDVTTSGIADDGDASTGMGKTTSQLQSPTQTNGYVGIYLNWNLNLDGTAGVDDPWDFGTASQYPALKAEWDGDGTATAYEFGRQGRATPVVAPVNTAPTFDAGYDANPHVAEDATAVGSYAATDPEGDALTYAVTGPDAADFAISSAGELTLINAADYETKSSYSVSVTVHDGKDAAGAADTTVDSTLALTVTVDDTPPPTAPTDVQVDGRANGLVVTWRAPVMPPTHPPLLGHTVQYSLRTSGPGVTPVTWGSWVAFGGDGTRLTPGSTYRVRVLVYNAEGDSPWTEPVNGVPVAAPVVDYDSDADGLIEVRSLAQLNAIRYDLNGDGATSDLGYAAAFPNPMAGMGCSGGCSGYELMADLDFDENNDGAITEVDDPAYWNGGEGWDPLGGNISTGSIRITIFGGVFEGNNHSIANLFIARPDRKAVGLFGGTDGNASIRNLSLTNANVSGGERVGALVGYSVGDVSSSSATGQVNAAGKIGGGLVGLLGGMVTGSHANVTVSGGNQLGGLVGYIHDTGAIAGSYATGNVSGDSKVGGLVGHSRPNSVVTRSYASGGVTATATGGDAGGLVGRQLGLVQAAYATGSVTATGAAGGLTGVLGGSLEASYATGQVQSGGMYVGGLVGAIRGAGAVTNGYWDTAASGQSSSAGGMGKTTAELQTPTGYNGIYANWNVDVDADSNDDDPWDFGTSSEYPALKYDTDGDGTATAYEFGRQGRSAPVDYDHDDDGLIEVRSLAQLNAIRYDLNGDGATSDLGYAAAFPNPMAGMGCSGGCSGYELMADLDFDENNDGAITEVDDPAYWNGGEGWDPLGGNISTGSIRITIFGGVFEGNNHAIANLFIARPDRKAVGLFGGTDGNASIRNLSLTNANVSGGERVGALVGYSVGDVSSSSATGQVNAAGKIGGGLVGLLGGMVTGSHANVTVSGGNQLGGLVGYIHDTGAIAGSYATGNVSGDSKVGGLVGHSRPNSVVTRSYASGGVTATGGGGGGGIAAGGDAGGLVGRQLGLVQAAYATGSVTATGAAGGLTGVLGGSLEASYATGQVQSGGMYVGGLVGAIRGAGAVTNGYWDTAASGQSSSAGGMGKTTAELQTPTGYNGIYADWNVDLDADGANDDPWDFGTSSEYPALKYDTDNDGTATWEEFGAQPRTAPAPVVDYDSDADGLIEVRSLAQLNAIRWDLNGDGATSDLGYAAAFPNPMAGMGCSGGCSGYELMADLDFDENNDGAITEVDDPAYWNGGEGWDPLGGNISTGSIRITIFGGVFEGNNHAIANLFIARPDRKAVGLFGGTDGNASIRNLSLTNANVSGGERVGALVGYSVGDVSSSSATGQVNAAGKIGGGLVGLLGGMVTGSHANVTVSGGNQLGGLVGYIHDTGAIAGSYATGNVSGDSKVGGLVGHSRPNSVVTRSYASGGVTATGGGGGGGIAAGGDAGGLVGRQLGLVQAAYATGSVTATGAAGGLTGVLGGSLEASYATGQVQSGGMYVGGLVGAIRGAGAVTNGYWDTAASGQSSSAGGMGKTTAELQTPTGYNGIYANWNVDVDADSNDDDPWDFGTSSEYPALKSDFNNDGTATAAEFGSQHSMRVARSARSTRGAELAPPGQPAAPSFINVAQTAFRITWTASAAGSSAISGYGIQYKLDSEEDSAYADVNPTPTGTVTGYNLVNRNGQTITAGTSYHVRVRAKNAEGWGLWSEAASVVTAGAAPSEASNNPPSFAAASATVEVAENSAADTAIANSPTATDPDVGDTLTYTLGTTMDDGHFAIDTGSGQLRTKGDLDYESKDSYAVTVTATDGGGLSASVEVTITVTDVADTPPGQPATPEIINVEETSFRVTWTAPADGSSAITGYGIQYKLASEEDSAYADVKPTPTGTATGYNLVNRDGQTVAEGTSYAVRVRARNAEGWGPWSEAASAVTAGAAPSEASNNPPSFAAASATVEVAENTASGTAIGDPVTATDPDVGDTLTYGLDASGDHSHFAIDTASGQLRTSGALDYEGTSSYAVTVTVSDGNGGTASVDVTITVTDVADTPPGQPDTPEIINVEETSFRVTWTAPVVGSSAITGYGIQYKLASEEDSAYADVKPTPTGTVTGYNLVNRGGQTVAEGTSYAVRVRAKNAEGWGLWSEAASVVTAGGVPPNEGPANGDEAEADDSGQEEPKSDSYQATAHFITNQGRVLVKWDEVDGAAYYLIGKNGQPMPGRTDTTTLYDADVEEGTRYEYRITAYDGEDNELAVMTAATDE